MKKIVLGSLIAAATLMANVTFVPKCSGCHGAQGERKALGQSEIIKGWDVAKTTAALKGYQNGTYGKAQKMLMKGQVAGLTDANIEALAKEIASFK